MKKNSRVSKSGIILTILGLIGLIINMINFCTGWNVINPFCWGFAMIVKLLALIFGVLFLVIGLILILKKLIKEK